MNTGKMLWCHMSAMSIKRDLCESPRHLGKSKPATWMLIINPADTILEEVEEQAMCGHCMHELCTLLGADMNREAFA